jgi:hypothetical protein
VKRFWTDRIALATAGIGIVLMVLALVWRVNPVEGSVMPDFLTSNPFGLVLTFVLLATCLPVGILAIFPVIVLGSIAGLSESEAWPAGGAVAIVLQGIVYFMLGKLISLYTRRFRSGTNRTP